MRTRGSLPIRYRLTCRTSLTFCLLLLAASGCLDSRAAAQSAWTLAAPKELRRTGTLHEGLDESSGVAASRRYPGVLWSFNDSGNPASLFATDTSGRDRGRFSVTAAQNVDWEALALGPCGKAQCLYIADTGDNRAERPVVQLYRIAEPDPAGAAAVPQSTRPAQVLRVRYPGGPRDVEAIFVAGQGDTYLISKGAEGKVELFRVAADRWTSRIADADLLGTLPIEAGSALGQLVTDAALAPDGRRVAVRTYRAIFFFSRAPDGTLRPAPPGIACNVLGLESQGEGVTWLDDRTLALTSEAGFRDAGAVGVARCG
ncbi:MAG: hypothetical protein M3477_02350 [Gemmatimonadota bacterium]|nr:hypothetical protein [Gemmatimonadota bacterium]